MVLSLHGAGVEATGQARSYAAKDWAVVVAPTNRRPFGFDWEAWGRLDAIEVLDDAMAQNVDVERVYLTGHSMGGHGTWQLGVHFPGRFAVVAPSAGWRSFATYRGDPPLAGALARANAASDTERYAANLAQRAVYVIHGSADDNVPVEESRAMVALLDGVVEDLTYHEQPDAGHWWDGDAGPGADCVDWPPLFEVMADRRLDPLELDFDFIVASPSVNATHAAVTIEATLDPLRDARVTGNRDCDTWQVTTDNVLALLIHGDALTALGVTTLEVDGERRSVGPGPPRSGPNTVSSLTVMAHGYLPWRFRSR